MPPERLSLMILQIAEAMFVQLGRGSLRARPADRAFNERLIDNSNDAMTVSDSLQQSEDRDEATQEDAEESDEDHDQSDFEDPEESDFTPPRFPDPADDEELQSSQASVARDLSSLLHDEDSQPQEKDAVLLESQMSANCLLDIIRSHCEGTLNEIFLVK
jgi:hypothetical protein